MQNRIFNLNLFAEDHTPETEQNPETGRNPEAEQESKPEAEKKYTDAEVDEIINKKFAKWQADKDKAIADAKAEAEKLAKMNSEQKRQYEAEKKDRHIAELEQQIEDYKKDALRTELSKSAAHILKDDHNIVATQDMLDFVVGGDAESTKSNIAKLVGIILDDRKAQDEKRAVGRTPRAYTGSGEQVTEIQKRINKYKRH